MVWDEFSLFFFNDTATTEIYTLSLHDALPISRRCCEHERSRIDTGGVPIYDDHIVTACLRPSGLACAPPTRLVLPHRLDRKSTRLNSSHANISYAVFCLKKKK